MKLDRAVVDREVEGGLGRLGTGRPRGRPWRPPGQPSPPSLPARPKAFGRLAVADACAKSFRLSGKITTSSAVAKGALTVAEVVEIVERNAEWMFQVDIPKLFINIEPGYNITGRTRDFCRTWPAQTEVTVPGLHYLQEDSPDYKRTALTSSGPPSPSG
jgi:hypothetical protein